VIVQAALIRTNLLKQIVITPVSNERKANASAPTQFGGTSEPKDVPIVQPQLISSTSPAISIRRAAR